jgi:glutamine amidotransferase
VNARLTIALCDLGLGNLRSVETALLAAAESRGQPIEIETTRDPHRIEAADRVVVPGQGAFRDGSRALEGRLGDALRDVIARGKPYLGICLGLQLLFDASEEAEGAKGLGVFAGTVRRLSRGEGVQTVKIPHMGWNEIQASKTAPRALTKALGVSRWMYFVHSFHAVPDDSGLICATAEHGPNTITAAIARGSILATQFHPEKSQRAGVELLAEFLMAET